MVRTLTLLAAAALLVVAAACSGDDDDSGNAPSSREGGETTSTSGDQPADINAAAYDEEIRSNFVGSCTAGGSTEDFCRCAIDQIAANVPLEDFVAYENRLQDDPAAELPQPIKTALQDCANP
ncbi:MAG TPA: hypothetical protein VGJ86_08005 [Acidimicrobiales bacterium]